MHLETNTGRFLASLTLCLTVVIASCSSAVVESTPDSSNSPSSTTTRIVTTTTEMATTSTTEAVTTTTTRPPIDDPFVEVNGVRLVYRCTGDGAHTVLVDQYAYGPATNPPNTADFMGWQAVVDGVDDAARICVYNRRGVGASDNTRNGTALRTTQDMVDDLVGVIDALDLAPVVMVAHSMAGLNVQLLADQHPDLIEGAVYVDAVHPEAYAQISGYAPAEPPEYFDAWNSYLLVSGKGDMGDKPVYVITAGRFFQGEDAETWFETHELLAAMSTTSVHVLLEDSGHRVQGTRPDAIIEGIQWVISQLE